MKTKGYTKTKFGKMDLMKLLTEKVWKDPNEPFETWFARKIEEQYKGIDGGMDERVRSRKGADQSPKPLS